MAASCVKCGELHVNDENVLLEEADTGEIYVTDLTNFATPFIRYRIGDRGRLGEPLASCRPGLSRIVSLEGRTMDVLETAGGRRVSAAILPHVLKDFSEIRGYQLWQPTLDRVQILVAANTEPPRERIRRAFASHFDGAAIEVIWVDQLPTTAGGKLKFVVRDAEYAGPRQGE
jgi:phenylacetate-CoA ligase